MFKLAYYILRLLLLPFVHFLGIVHPKFKARIKFEGVENISIDRHKPAQYAFEVSSEGELQQVFPVIENLLENGKLIELLYCSPSVEKDCLKLLGKYSGQINLLSLPILSFSPFKSRLNPVKWITAPVLIFCRYDFFPELFLNKNLKRWLISGSAKNLETKAWPTKAYQSWCYRKMEKIIAATLKDKDIFIQFLGENIHIRDFDFRVVQINQRLIQANTKLIEEFPGFALIQELFNQTQKKKVIFGNYWEVDTTLVSQQDLNKNLVFIVPHNLDSKLEAYLSEKLSTPVYEINKESSLDAIKESLAAYNKDGGVWLVNLKGILCELYSLFDYAYIGGGFGVSVHSLLEPYLAGCECFCGPNTSRSTEKDWIAQSKWSNQLTILSSLKEGSLITHKDYRNKLTSQRSVGDELDQILNWLLNEE